MAASDYTLLAEYPRQPVVRDRNYVALNNWANYTATLPVPPVPDNVWVKSRIVAERYPAQTMSYVDRTMSYFLQDPATQTNIREFLSAFNTEATETALASQLESIIGGFMPRFADIDVTDSQANDWKTAHGIAA